MGIFGNNNERNDDRYTGQTGDPVHDEIYGWDMGSRSSYDNSRINNNVNTYNKVDSSKLYNSACELRNEKQLEEALTIINILIDRNPDNDKYWNVKGLIYWDMTENNYFADRQYEEALKCLNIALKLNPSDDILVENKCNFLIDYANYLYLHDEYFPAISKIDDALTLLNPNKSDKHTLAKAWNLKGLCYHSMGNPEAFKCYDEALKYEPNNEVIKDNKNSLRHYQGIDNEYFYG